MEHLLTHHSHSLAGTRLAVCAVMLWLLAGSVSGAATITAGQKDELSAKAALLRNGDTLRIVDGTFRGRIELRGKSNILITAAEVRPVTVSIRDAGTDRETPWASGPTVTIDAGGTGNAIYLEDCADVTIRGLRVVGGKPQGIRLVNCNRVTIEDTIVEANADSGLGAAQVPEDHDRKPGSRPGGHKLVRFVAQGNGGHGFGMSFQKGVTCIDTGSFFNNRGWPSNEWGKEGRNIGGKWFAFVQHSGGGGKWAGCDDVSMQRHWTAGNNGYGLWFDWLNTNIVIRHSLFGRQWWNQNSYDDGALHFEICDGPALVEDCLFDSGQISAQVSESWNITFKDCLFFRGVPATRNLPNRMEGIKNLVYENCRFWQKQDDGERIAWWKEGDEIWDLRRDSTRARRGIKVVNPIGAHGEHGWKFDWGDSLETPAPAATPAGR